MAPLTVEGELRAFKPIQVREERQDITKGRRCHVGIHVCFSRLRTDRVLRFERRNVSRLFAFHFECFCKSHMVLFPLDRLSPFFFPPLTKLCSSDLRSSDIPCPFPRSNGSVHRHHSIFFKQLQILVLKKSWSQSHTEYRYGNLECLFTSWRVSVCQL